MTGTDGQGRLSVRSACEADIDDVAAMIDDFVKGHPAERHPRPMAKLREALFGDAPAAHLLLAIQRGRVVGMVQWFRIYDVFWAMCGAHAEWLYVRPDVRGMGIAAALIAEVCAQARLHSAEFLHGAGSDEMSRLYERVAIGAATRECHLSAQAFQAFADLAGQPVREIVRHLPAPSLNREAVRRRAADE